MSNTQLVEFTVNGEARRVEVFPMARLLDVLREQLQLTGTKEGLWRGGVWGVHGDHRWTDRQQLSCAGGPGQWS